MNPFADLLNDVVFIEGASGRLGPFKSAISKGSAPIFDVSVSIEPGEHLLRQIPGNKFEKYRILDCEYSPGLSSIPPHFTLNLQKVDAIQPSQSKAPVTFNINNSTGFQVGDHNNMQIHAAISELAQRIDSGSGSAEEKKAAKSALRHALEHPLIAAVIGAAAGEGIKGVLG